MASPEIHAKCGASNAHRYLVCTASPTFEAQFPASTSVYAEEGTLAHSICELFVKTRGDVDAMAEELRPLQRNKLYQPEMLTCAKVYCDWIMEKALGYTNPPTIMTEQQVDFSDVVPDGFGTCDCVMIGDDTLNIFDYKHGKGVRVDAMGNPQMRLYALGALARYRPLYGDAIKKVRMTIIQPRISADPSEDEMTVDDLLAWGAEIHPLAVEAFNGPGVFVPGEHCKFCRGKAKCRARANINTALEDFAACIPMGRIPADEPKDNITRRAMGLQKALTDDEIGQLLTRGQFLVSWYDDLKAYAQQTILDGGEIPGWKVVAGRSVRAFHDTDAAFQTLIKAGYDEAMLYDRKPVSLSELEKRLGKKKFADLLADQIDRPMGKPTLVDESDKREPYNSAAADFGGVNANV